ncbi:TauD/TfdA family dioxygenase [Aspergillus lucknowensis]|uniref:TauD/TfdA-like domain-containing protein n=1 Tax=Aspergillus lucknowensis TaxID=176173 RepID=A0ABR4L8W4_9EURO
MSPVAVIPPVPVGPAGQPDIQYLPDPIKYAARTKRRQQTEQLSQTLPEGFPQKLVSELEWDGKDLVDEYDWNYHLTEQDIQEIEAALQHFKDLGVPLGKITQETFPLPRLHGTLRSISREIHLGHGFKVVCGVPVDQHSREENIIIYAGIASHIAPIRGRQDSQLAGKPADVVLAHITDLSRKVDVNTIKAPAYTTEKQVFHTDSGDVISLFALSEAAHGGQSYLSSSWHVYNELARTRPDLIRTLAEPWVSEQGSEAVSRPLLYHQPQTTDAPERLIIQYARRGYTGYWGKPRNPSLPPITEAQAEALDALHYLAEKSAVSLDFHKGDIQFVNNLSIFHARAEFTDSEEKRRHLVRLWLRDPELAWETPEGLKSRWETVYGGIDEEKSVFPLEPFVRSQ